jgi:hypothetical protein
MSRKLTLIEYDSDIFAGDGMDPAIQFRDQLGAVTGQRPVAEAELHDVDIVEIARRIEDMRVYARVISSSSSSSASSSSETALEELFEHHETGGDDSYTIGQTGYAQTLAQTFTPDIAHRISRVELELFDNQGNGLTGQIAVSIKATDVNGKPTGSALASGTIDSADLNPGHYSETYNGIYESGIGYSAAGSTDYLGEVCFSQDGLHMYAFAKDAQSGPAIYHYTLSPAWDITSAVEDEVLDIMGGLASDHASGIFLKPDGTRIYIVFNTALGGSYVRSIDLDVAFYITSCTFNSAVALYGTGSQYSCWFNDAGTRLFTADDDNDDIFQYNLSTAWDETSLSATPSRTLDVSSYTTSPWGVALSADGLTLQVIDAQHDKILFWNLSTAFDLLGASKDSYEMDISGTVTTPVGCYTKADGKTFFVCTPSALTVYQFDLPALHGDWHSCDLGDGYELAAATQYAACASYAGYEAGVSEPEWVNNADGDDNYAAGTMLRFDGTDWFDS